MNLLAIIQARVGSTRLPGKAVRDMAGKPMVLRVAERLARTSFFAGPIIIAVPSADWSEFRDIKFPAERCMLFAWEGPEEDVCGRHIAAASEFGHHVDAIIRVPSDNPCVDPEIVDRLCYAFDISSQEDRARFMWTAFPALRNEMPDGVGAEIHSIQVLIDSWERGNPFQREHPHRLPIAENRIRTIRAAKEIRRPDVKLDVDQWTDFQLVSQVFARLGDHFTTKEAIDAYDQILAAGGATRGSAAAQRV